MVWIVAQINGGKRWPNRGATINRAARNSGQRKRVTWHALRNSYATHLPKSDTDIQTVQTLLGRIDVSTTMIHAHMLQHVA